MLINALVAPSRAPSLVKGEEIQGTTPKQDVIDHANKTIPSDRHRWGPGSALCIAENMALSVANEETFVRAFALDLKKIMNFQKLIDVV